MAAEDALSPLASIIVGIVILTISVLLLLVLYPLTVISAQTLIETPYGVNCGSSTSQFQLVNSEEANTHDLNDGFDINEEDPMSTSTSKRRQGVSESRTEPPELQTMSIRKAIYNLQRAGRIKGLFRAFSAELTYTWIFGILFALFNSDHATRQLARRIGSEDPTFDFNFNVLSILIAIVLKIVLMPLSIVITLQLVSYPTSTTWPLHLWFLLRRIGIKPLAPLVFPTVLAAAVPELVQNLTAWLHFLYLAETQMSPFWFAVFGVTEVIFRLFTLVFIVAPLHAVLYRAHTSVLSYFPTFDAIVAYPTNYISPLAELKTIVEEEKDISGRWYGRYLRYFRVIVVISGVGILGAIAVVGLLAAAGFNPIVSL